MESDLTVHAIDGDVDQNVLGDGVVVIGIIRRVLEVPLDLAAIRIQGEC